MEMLETIFSVILFGKTEFSEREKWIYSKHNIYESFGKKNEMNEQANGISFTIIIIVIMPAYRHSSTNIIIIRWW